MNSTPPPSLSHPQQSPPPPPSPASPSQQSPASPLQQPPQQSQSPASWPQPSTPPQPPPPATEIAFFDVETTIPSRATPGYSLLEFGAILVCPRRLVEVGSYSTLVRPADLTAISAASVRCNGITPDAVASAPSFKEVADSVFGILDGRVWAGHNIARFDCVRIKEAFAEIGRKGPEPRGLVDTLPLLTQKFGRRAGDMKMATMASYFGLGKQSHRSLDDVRMNLEVLKYCATVLFLESSFTDMFSVNSWVSENNTRSRVNVKASPERITSNSSLPSDLSCKRKLPSTDCRPIVEVNHHVAGPSMSVLHTDPDPSDLISHIAQINLDPLQTDSNTEQSSARSPEMFATATTSSEGSSGFAGFLDPHEVSTQDITSHVSIHHYGCRIVLLHKDAPLQLYSTGLRVHFGLSNKFVDHAGRPKLSIVVNIPANLCQILDSCEHLARKSSLESGSSSQWRPVVKKNGYSDSLWARLNIPTAASDDAGIYSTEIYQKEQSGNLQKIVFSKPDPAELESVFVPGTTVDAFFGVDFYDYQNSAGLRLVAKRLIAHPK